MASLTAPLQTPYSQAPPGYPESPQKTGLPPIGFPQSPPEYPQVPLQDNQEIEDQAGDIAGNVDDHDYENDDGSDDYDFFGDDVFNLPDADTSGVPSRRD